MAGEYLKPEELKVDISYQYLLRRHLRNNALLHLYGIIYSALFYGL
tara:strand:+ start:8143 stop:8280 length:138 start_codon:yes stop_codon:yes gene_type:complete